MPIPAIIATVVQTVMGAGQQSATGDQNSQNTDNKEIL